MLECSQRHSSACFALLLFAVLLLLLPANSSAAEKKASTDGHPIVPGFERFHADGTESVKGGRLLLGELNCISCHKPEGASESALQRKQAPILDGVGGRVRRSFLRKFLRDPKAIKPGTTMPNLFAALPEVERRDKIEALVHFLAATGTLPKERADARAAAAGQQLYHRVGCVACHGRRDDNGNAAKVLADSVPLGDLRAKYSIRSLAAFLENPQAVRPSGRMPGLLNNQEAKQVANYLLRGQILAQTPANMRYAYYEGTWDKLPNFANLKPLAEGKAPGFDVNLARRPGDFALRFEGYLRIDRAGD
jgi:mono/diheme cytochrome c family protein